LPQKAGNCIMLRHSLFYYLKGTLKIIISRQINYKKKLSEKEVFQRKVKAILKLRLEDIKVE
jgi:hypothetical protein